MRGLCFLYNPSNVECRAYQSVLTWGVVAKSDEVEFADSFSTRRPSAALRSLCFPSSFTSGASRSGNLSHVSSGPVASVLRHLILHASGGFWNSEILEVEEEAR